MKRRVLIVDSRAVDGSPFFEQQANQLGILAFDGHMKTAQAILVSSVHAAALVSKRLLVTNRIAKNFS